MNRQVWTRPLDRKSKKECELFVKWLYDQRELNKFDPELITKDQVRVYTLFDHTGIVGFTVASTAILMDYIAFRPELADTDKARALKSVQHFLVTKAHEQNVPNVFFRPSDERYAQFVASYGWKLEEKLHRLHLADLEGKEPMVEETHEDKN
jgi:hypothetical protein